MRRGVLLTILLGVFVLIVVVVAFRRPAPVIPADADHLPSRGRPEECMGCHGPDGGSPRGPNHPFGMQCWSCHYEEGESRG